ncbi:MAG: hypothetical protein AAGA77_07310 [Bacteroidota bacterium]
MQRLSSNLTLFLKLTVPVAWISFFGLFGLVIFIVDTSDKPLLAAPYFRYGYVSFFFLFLILIYFTIYQLKRVEHQDGFIFTTDYFKTIKFPIENIDRISTMNLWLIKVVWFHLKAKGIFGKRIPFIAKKSNFESFQMNYPHFFKADSTTTA